MVRRILILLTVLISVTGCGYNSLQQLDEQINASWSEVLNQYQRRADLIPSLVNVVKGYAAHEKEVLQQVTDARAKVGTVNVQGAQSGDLQALKQFQEAQQGLGQALSRLIAVAENYPQLKADGVFRDLQAQLEGTENRIAVSRQRYIKAVQDYNTVVRSFPSNLTAKLFGFSTKQNFAVENESTLSKPPTVSF